MTRRGIDGLVLRFQARLRGSPVVYRFTLATRVLLAVAFIPTGAVKLLGHRFMNASTEYPLGRFFEVLYESRPYWQFLGGTQVAAGVLLLIPATATLGALVFQPVILNIFVITLSYDFNFTPAVTCLMVLAVLYLLCWDYDRIRPVVVNESSPIVWPRLQLTAFEAGTYFAGTAAALVFLMGDRIAFYPRAWNAPVLLFGCLAAVSAIIQTWLNRKVVDGQDMAGVSEMAGDMSRT